MIYLQLILTAIILLVVTAVICFVIRCLLLRDRFDETDVILVAVVAALVLSVLLLI